MSEATEKLTTVFWDNPELRPIAQLAIMEIDVLTVQRDAALSACSLAMNSVECASICVQTGEELPWYRSAKAALAMTPEQARRNDA
jgi:hypothetical protein